MYDNDFAQALQHTIKNRFTNQFARPWEVVQCVKTAPLTFSAREGYILFTVSNGLLLTATARAHKWQVNDKAVASIFQSKMLVFDQI